MYAHVLRIRRLHAFTYDHARSDSTGLSREGKESRTVRIAITGREGLGFTHRLRPGWNEGILKFTTGRYGGVMAPLQQTIKAVIRAGDEVGYVAECMEIAVVTQGRTLDETVKHLQEATALHLEAEHLADFGLREKPTLVLTMELDPAHAQAS